MSNYNVNAIEQETEFTDIKSNSASALFAFHEYVSSALIKCRDFMNNIQGSRNVMTLPYEIDDHNSVLVSVTSQQYQDALDNLEGTTTVYDSLNNERVFENEKLAQLFQDNISELCVQKEFIGSCLTGISFAATDLITRVKGIYPGVPGYIIEKYSRLVDNSSITSSLQNLFSLSRYNTIQNDDGLITVYSADGYTGANVWLVALQQIGDQIASFFVNVVWKGITKIGEFFREILNGLKNLAIWLVSRLASQFLTNYAKTSSAIGLIDFPLMQFWLGKPFFDENGKLHLNIDRELNNTNVNWFDIASDSMDTLYSSGINVKNYTEVKMSRATCKQYRIISPHGYMSHMGINSGLFNVYLDSFYKLLPLFCEYALKTENDDGSYSIRPFDVVIPVMKLTDKYFKDRGISYTDINTLMDVALRFGLDERGELWMQVYCVDTYENLHSFTDRQNARRMQVTMMYLPTVVSSTVQSVPNIDVNKYNVDDYTTLSAGLTGALEEYFCFKNDPTQPWDTEATYDLVGNLRVLDVMKTCYYNRGSQSWVNNSLSFHYGNYFAMALFNMYSLLAYALINSPYRQDMVDIWDWSENPDRPKYVVSTHQSTDFDMNFADGNNVFNTILYGTIEYEDTSGLINLDYTGWANSFRSTLYNLFVPYSKNILTPVSVHYQDINEQAAEIRNGIWTILIAAAVIFASYKIIKFTKNQRLKQQLAQAAMDQFSWDFAKSPTTENFNKFVKARKKFKKVSIMNNILGVTSSAAIEQSTSAADAVINMIRGVQKGDTNEPSILTLINLIQGV